MINIKSAQVDQTLATEVLFNSVEVELARRWAHGDVPPMFVGRPVDHLQKIVKAWWQIYHESTAAANGRNRTLWERSQSYPAEALDTAALVEILKKVRELIDLTALSVFRPIHQAEHSAVGILDLSIAHYVNLVNQTPS